jgi:hypothetical protein
MPKSAVRFLTVSAVVFSPLLFGSGASAQVVPQNPVDPNGNPETKLKTDLNYLNREQTKPNPNLNTDPKYLNLEDAKPATILNDDSKNPNRDVAKPNTDLKDEPKIDLNAQESISPSYWK